MKNIKSLWIFIVLILGVTKKDCYSQALTDNNFIFGVSISDIGNEYGLYGRVTVARDLLKYNDVLTIDYSINFNRNTNDLRMIPAPHLFHVLWSQPLGEKPLQDLGGRIIASPFVILVPDGVSYSTPLIGDKIYLSVNAKPLQSNFYDKEGDFKASVYSAIGASLDIVSGKAILTPYYQIGSSWSGDIKHSQFGVKLGVGIGY